MEAFFPEDFNEKDQPIAILLTRGCIRTLPGSQAPWLYPSQDDPGRFKVMSFVYGLLPPLCPRMELLYSIKPFADKKEKEKKKGLLLIFSSDLQLNLSQIPSYNENHEDMFSEEKFIRYLHRITCLTSPIF